MSLDMIPTHYPFEDMVEAQDTPPEDTVNIEIIANDAFQARQVGQVEFLDDTDITTDLLAYDIDQEVNPHEANNTILCTQIRINQTLHYCNQMKSQEDLVQSLTRIRKQNRSTLCF